MLCHAVLAHFCLVASEYPKSSGSFLMFDVLLLLCMLVLQQLYFTTEQSTFNMGKGLYSSLVPPDISRLVGQPAIMFSA